MSPSQAFGAWTSLCYEGCGRLLVLDGPGALLVCADCRREQWLSWKELERRMQPAHGRKHVDWADSLDSFPVRPLPPRCGQPCHCAACLSPRGGKR